MARQEFKGRSAAEAAIKACEALGVSRSALRYEVVSETGEGLNRIVVIAAEAPAERPRPSPGVQTSADRGESSDEAPGEGGGGGGDRDSGDRPERSDRGDRGDGGGRSRRGRGGRGRGGEGRDMRGGGGDRGGRDRDRGGGGRPRRDDRSRPTRAQQAQNDDGLEALLNMESFASLEVPARTVIEGGSGRAQKAREVLTQILQRMGITVAVKLVQDEKEEIHFDLDGADEQRAIGKKGETLLSLQFIVNRIVGRDEDGEQHVVLDAGGYRHRRRAALADLAKRLASRALQERKVVRLSPMSAHDRRIFHITLAEMAGVSTRSQGDGLYRPLLIIPQEASEGQ